MKILIFGSKGYLGQQILKLFPKALSSDVDIADADVISKEFERHKPHVVINAAGKTGKPNVDWCEEHKEETLRSNVTGPLVLLEECLERGIFLVHLSSGCIYEGDNGGEGFSEEDQPNFSGSFYARTKAWTDQILRDFPVLILRLRMPFDSSTSDRNLIMKLKRYPKVLDVQNSLTALPDFLTAARTLIERKRIGIYNVVNPGSISPYRIMQLYRDIVDPAHVSERLTLEELPRVVKAGRSNCVLSTEKLAKEGISLQPVEEAVREALLLLKQSMFMPV